MEGRADARQLSESADDFIKRVSPLSSAALGPWLWVYNPKARDADKVEDDEVKSKARDSRKEDGQFTVQCHKLMTDYLETEAHIKEEMHGKAKSAVTRKLTPLRLELREQLLDVSKGQRNVCGKVSLPYTLTWTELTTAVDAVSYR